MICSYFMGEMMVDREDQVDMNVSIRGNMQDTTNAVLRRGGEVVSGKLADILKHLASKCAI
jgi:hypothetical protein